MTGSTDFFSSRKSLCAKTDGFLDRHRLQDSEQAVREIIAKAALGMVAVGLAAGLMVGSASGG